MTVPDLSQNETFPGNATLAMAAQRAQTYADAAHAPGTLSVYRRTWSMWVNWCADMRTPAVPAAPETIAAWLAELARTGKSIARIQVCLSAVLHGHRLQGHEVDSGHPALARVMRGVARKAARPVRRARPLTVQDLEAALPGLAESDARSHARSLRDRALLLVAFWGALRRSEIVSLDIRGRSPIAIHGKGIVLRLTGTKSSAATVEVVIPRRSDALCAVAAVEAYVTASQVNAGPLFRAVSKSGRLLERRLGASSIAHILSQRLGPKASEFSPHSLRAGFVTAAARAGAPEHVIQRTTRHKSADVLRAYIRDLDAFEESAAAYLG
jgi:integrase